MNIKNFVSNIFGNDSNSTVTIKAGRYEHTFPYSEVKGKTIREVAALAAEFIHIDASKISRAERLVAADSVVEPNSTVSVEGRIEPVALTEEVTENGTYGVDVEYGRKG